MSDDNPLNSPEAKRAQADLADLQANRTPLDGLALDTLFRRARTVNGWQDKDVPNALLHELHALYIMAPTSANQLPMRVKYLKSTAAKAQLKPALMEANQAKTLSAPVAAVLAYDLEFYEHLPRLFPHTDAKSWFTGSPAFAKTNAFRNASMQAGYFILAARALGLDCGPMTGLNLGKAKDLFWPDDNVVVNMVCNLGYGDPDTIFQRSPRFAFDDISEIL